MCLNFLCFGVIYYSMNNKCKCIWVDEAQLSVWSMDWRSWNDYKIFWVRAINVGHWKNQEIVEIGWGIHWNTVI